MDKKEYICVADYQDTCFHIGDTKSAEDWKEWALSTSDMEESEMGEIFASFTPLEAIDYIADMWQIELVEFNPTNAEHIKLRQNYEGRD